MATVSNIVIGKATVYIGAANTVTALPADTVAYGGSWSSWTDLGYTNGGASLKFSNTVHEITSDQENGVLAAIPTDEVYEITLNLQETTMSNLKRATSMGTLSTSGSTEVLDFGSQGSMDYYSIGLEGKSPQGLYRRCVVHKAFSTGNIELKFAKDGESMYVVTFKAMLDTSKAVGAKALQIRDRIA